MLGSDVRTLCDANYVNNPQVSTMDGSWLIQAYPGGASEFSAFVGTRLQCQGTAASGTITISSAARTITLRILGDEPGAVRRDNVVLPGQGTPGSGITRLALRRRGGLYRDRLRTFREDDGYQLLTRRVWHQGRVSHGARQCVALPRQP